MAPIPLVSIIIPSRNRHSSVLKCIQNVRAQTYPNTEIIVINDCCEEDYSDLAQQPVRYYCTDRHGGAALARNVGLHHAQGEYISFIDDDDAWLPTKLEIQFSRMREKGAKFCSTEGYMVTDKSNILASPIYHRGYFRDFMMKDRGSTTLPTEFKLEFLLRHNYIITSSVMMHREVYEKIGTFNESEQFRRGQDYEYWKRVLSGGYSCLYLDDPLIFYRAY